MKDHEGRVPRASIEPRVWDTLLGVEPEIDWRVLERQRRIEHPEIHGVHWVCHHFAGKIPEQPDRGTPSVKRYRTPPLNLRQGRPQARGFA